jgi:Protein of unknown function (DUF3037)
MAVSEKHELEFFLLRYVPDVVRGEFVNVGLLMYGESAGFADVQFTKNWRRVFCLDPGADVEWLLAMEREMRARVQDAGSRADLLYRLQDLCSNTIQLSPVTGCLAEDAAAEFRAMTKTYVDPPALRAGKAAPSARQRIVRALRSGFEKEGVLNLMLRDVAVEEYTYAGDPLKIDFAYRGRSMGAPEAEIIRMFQAVSLSANVDAAKVLAYSYPQMADGIRRKENVGTSMTAVVEDGLDMTDEAILFVQAMMERTKITVASVSDVPGIAQVARRELGV